MPTRTRRTAALLGGLLLAAGTLGACGDDDDVDTATGDVPEDATGDGADSELADDGMDPADGDDEGSTEAARQRAQELLGTPEAELEVGPDLRIGRRGDEQFMLTEDYVLGRITVELDDDGTGTFVVTQATVELPDGPETFTLDQD